MSLLILVAGPVLAWSQEAGPGQETPRAARWAPADKVLIYAEISDPEAVMERIHGDFLGLLRGVPGYEKMLDNQQTREALGVLRYLSDALGTTPEETLFRAFGGHMEIVVTGENQVALVVEPKDAAFLQEAHDKLVKLAREDAETKGKPDPIKETDYMGVHAYSVGGEEAHAIIDGALVVVSKPDLLKGVIERVQNHDESVKSLADSDLWKERRAAAGDRAFWAIARLDRLREIDPKRFAMEKSDPGATLLLGTWLEAARKADWIYMGLDLTDKKLGLEVVMPEQASAYPAAMQGFIPGAGTGALAPLHTPNTIASVSLWRDLEAIWEARGELFPADAQQGFAQLDSFAGTFFGGRDFATGVLGSLGKQWRLVVARQDPDKLSPRPDVVLPAFALVVGVDADDADFTQRLKAAFQSFIGLANLGAAQQKAPPLMLVSEELDGVTISASRYLPPKDAPANEPVHQRFNFSPSAVQVGDQFVLSSSLELAKELVAALKNPQAATAQTTSETFIVDASGAELGLIIDQNRERMIADNILKKGQDRSQAEGEVALLKSLVEFLGKGQLTAGQRQDRVEFKLDFELAH